MELHVFFGHVKPLRHVGEKTLEDRLDFAAQHAFLRAGESGVGQIRRAAGENLFVRRLHVRVRAHYRADLPVEHPRKCDFFRGRLGVKIHEDDFRLLAQAFYFVAREEKRIFQRRHERAALRVQNRNRNRTLAFGLWPLDFKYGAALSRRAGRIIQRSQKAFFAGKQFHDFLLVPQMVAAGDDIHAGREDFPGGFGRDAGAAGGVFAIGDDEIERMLFTEFGQQVLTALRPGWPTMSPMKSSFTSRI